MRKVLLTAVLAAGSLLGATNEWVAPITKTVTVASVRADCVQVVRQAGGTIKVTVHWSWLDGTGNAVRTGRSEFTPAQLAAYQDGKGGAVLVALKALVLEAVAAVAAPAS